MEDQAELIRQQMQETRADLSEKLHTLGEMLPTETVAQKVESFADTVTTTAENVQETVRSMQEAFDLPKQVQEHPWLAVGGAVLVGYLAHEFLTARRRDGSSVLSEPLRQLEDVAVRTAIELAGRAVQGLTATALAEYAPLLEGIVSQFMSGASHTQSNGHATPHGPTPAGPRHPAQTSH